MCGAYLLKMTSDHPPGEQTPDQQRAARDKRWSKVKSMHWHTKEPTADTPRRSDDEYRARDSKPTDIPSRAPADDAA